MDDTLHIIDISTNNKSSGKQELGEDRKLYGVCSTDTWSFDFYLERVIANGLWMLRDRLYWTPCKEEFDEDGLEIWSGILTAIIDGFRIPEEERFPIADNHYRDDYELSKELLLEYWDNLWD